MQLQLEELRYASQMHELRIHCLINNTVAAVVNPSFESNLPLIVDQSGSNVCKTTNKLPLLENNNSVTLTSERDVLPTYGKELW